MAARVTITTQISTFRLNRAGVEYTVNSQEGPVGRYLHRKGKLMVLGARKMVGVESGRLQRSIHDRMSRTPYGQTRILGTRGVPYALSHHEGTRPHLITPKRAQALRFTAGGRVVYARSVMHPGTKPNKYLSTQLELVRV